MCALIYCMGTVNMQAQTCEGRVCLKNNTQQLYCVGLTQEWEQRLIELKESNRSSIIQRVVEILDDKQ